jgi:hypothetical protein
MELKQDAVGRASFVRLWCAHKQIPASPIRWPESCRRRRIPCVYSAGKRRKRLPSEAVRRTSSPSAASFNARGAHASSADLRVGADSIRVDAFQVHLQLSPHEHSLLRLFFLFANPTFRCGAALFCSSHFRPKCTASPTPPPSPTTATTTPLLPHCTIFALNFVFQLMRDCITRH